MAFARLLYAPLLLLLLLLLLLEVRTADGLLNYHQQAWDRDEAPYCYPFNYTCGPIAPSPPIHYEAHMEYVDMRYNITHYIEEFYDYEENVLAVMDSREGIYTHTIFMYSLNKAVFISTEKGVEDGWDKVSCSVIPISHEAWLNPYPGEDHSMLVLAPSQALFFGSDYRYTYVNNDTQRAMGCNRWDACINTPAGIFSVQYSWSDPSRVMDMYGFTSERPVMVMVKGEIRPPQGTTEPIPVEGVYSVTHFDDNPRLKDIYWAFEVPNGVYCEGLPSGKLPPNKLASAFSMRVEVTVHTSLFPDEEYMTTAKNWYDFQNRLTRSDVTAVWIDGETGANGAMEKAIIKDFRAKVQYVVDKNLGVCVTLPIQNDYDTITTPNGDIIIKDPLLLFGITGDANLTYHGTKYARGLPCDVWAGHMDVMLENGTLEDAMVYELYFLQEGWTEEAGTGPQKDFPVPVMISMQHDVSIGLLPQDEFTNIYQNIFKYEEQKPASSVFDITPCFTDHDHIRRFQMAFPSKYRDFYEADPESFTSRVREGLVLYLAIPLIRLQHTQIEYSEEQDRLFCEFTLVDQPQVEDVYLPPYVGDPLYEVVERLASSMDKIIIVIFDYDGQPMLMRPIADSLQEMFEDGCHSRQKSYIPQLDLENPYKSPATTENPKSATESIADNGDDGHKYIDNEYGGNTYGENGDRGYLGILRMRVKEWTRNSGDKIYSPGDMAGMALGMLALGLLLGTIIMLVLLRKMGLSSNIEFIPLTSRRQ